MLAETGVFCILILLEGCLEVLSNAGENHLGAPDRVAGTALLGSTSSNAEGAAELGRSEVDKSGYLGLTKPLLQTGPHLSPCQSRHCFAGRFNRATGITRHAQDGRSLVFPSSRLLASLQNHMVRWATQGS